ncbi:MAG TPA: ATP-binding protein, partial [Niabella sp.]|nr:ATP-binding protein [Niabella sp.]
RMRVEQVLANFITNGVKYSPESGHIEVLVEGLGQEVCVSVKDQGIGIAKENLRHIFSQFYRAPNIDTRISGLGLGLYISKQIVERHGGTVSVKSELGKGSVFTFCLPKNPVDKSG